MVVVADCERVQTAWFTARSEVCGGEVWTDEAQIITFGPDGQNLMFPETMTRGAVLRGVQRAQDRGLCIVGAWLNGDVDPTPLAQAGFTEGWSPWWMTAKLEHLELANDPRVEVTVGNPSASDDSPGLSDRVRLARTSPTRAWCATARDHPGGRPVGQAWSFIDGRLAGIFDMEVAPLFQRRGLGTGLLHAVCRAARDAGATDAVLNATPEGKALYSQKGFTQIGDGITWWRHLTAS